MALTVLKPHEERDASHKGKTIYDFYNIEQPGLFAKMLGWLMEPPSSPTRLYLSYELLPTNRVVEVWQRISQGQTERLFSPSTARTMRLDSRCFESGVFVDNPHSVQHHPEYWLGRKEELPEDYRGGGVGRMYTAEIKGGLDGLIDVDLRHVKKDHQSTIDYELKVIAAGIIEQALTTLGRHASPGNAQPRRKNPFIM